MAAQEWSKVELRVNDSLQFEARWRDGTMISGAGLNLELLGGASIGDANEIAHREGEPWEWQLQTQKLPAVFAGGTVAGLLLECGVIVRDVAILRGGKRHLVLLPGEVDMVL